MQGGIGLRKSTVIVLALIGTICMVAAPAQAGVVGVSSVHATLTLPTGWTYQRNYSDSGLTYDLYIESPAGAAGAIGMFGHEVQSKSLNSEQLWQDLQSEMESAGFTSFTYSVSPRNITVGGLPACDATISVSTGMVTVFERFTIAFSDDWNLVYVFVFAAASMTWSSYSSSIDSIVTSFSVEEKVGGDSSNMFVLIGLVVVIVAVVVVVVLLLMRRKKPEPAMVPPPMQPMPPAPPQNP